MDGYNGITTPRNIPLICTVCPGSPKFSDVSHLLTHIASKGHLHHETQTKLRAHQDLVSAVALQQYEQWYHDNGIEALLVERLKAKQIKEAMKGRVHRINTANKTTNTAPRTRKRSRRTTNDCNEHAPPDYAEAIPIYPGLFLEENDPELQEDLLQNNDMLSLKGQIWPGMGKMDLANEDMKRTRNQRKPKSAIDKMRRTSEGIEPTQVVLTSDFQVERVKGVYDSSSPIPGQEEATPPPPKRTARPRKKREPLVDLSTNIPVGHPDQNASLFARTHGQKRTQLQVPESIYANTMLPRQPMRSQNAFRDGQSPLNVYNDRIMAPSLHQNSKNLHYDHHGMTTINPISQSTSSLAARIATSKDTFSYNHDTPSGIPDLKHYNFSSGFSSRPDTANSINLSAFGGASRYALAMNSHFSAYDRVQDNESHPITPKHEDYFSLAAQTSVLNSSPNFLNISESNPLLNQDRPFFKSYLQSPSSKSHGQTNSFSGFKPINYRPEIDAPAENVASHDVLVDDIKVESQLCDIVHPSLHNDNDQPNFDTDGTWAADTMLDGLPADLGREASAV